MDTMFIKRLSVFVFTLLLVAPVLALQPPGGQTEFVAVNDLPAAEQLPAAPLLVTAYAFVWVALMFYLWTIWRRLGKVEADMRALEQRTARSSR
jgi:CcmD family protein